MREDKVDKILCTLLNGLVGMAIALIVMMLVMQAYIKRLDEQAAYYQGRYGLDRATAVRMADLDRMDAVARKGRIEHTKRFLAAWEDL